MHGIVFLFLYPKACYSRMPWDSCILETTEIRQILRSYGFQMTVKEYFLDFLHLEENVHNFARAKYGTDESEYKSWAKEMYDKLEIGRWEDVLAALIPDETYPYSKSLPLY